MCITARIQTVQTLSSAHGFECLSGVSLYFLAQPSVKMGLIRSNMYYHTFIRFLTLPSHRIPFPIHVDEPGSFASNWFKLWYICVSIHGRLYCMALEEPFCLIATRHPARSQVLQRPLYVFG
jgi:hypothetical protein